VSDEVLGRGLSFPLQISGTGLAESAGVARVEQSIRIILGTQYGERVMRPGFGANLKSLVFAPNNATTASLAGYYVTDALARWEPRIDVMDVRVETAPDARNMLLIYVDYRIRADNSFFNLVYPYYLVEGAR